MTNTDQARTWTRALVNCVSTGLLLLAFACDTNDHKPVVYSEVEKAINNAYSQCDAWIEKNQVPLVRAYLDSIYAEFQPLNDSQILRKYHYLANIYIYNAKDFDEAAKYLDSSARLLTNHETFLDLKLRHHFLRSNYYAALNDYDQALLALLEGKSILEQNYAESCKGVGFANSLAYLLYSQGHYEQALSAFQWRHKLHKICKSDLPHYNAFRLQLDHNEIGLCYEQLGQLDSALYHYDRGIAIIENFKANEDQSSEKLIRSFAVLLGNKGSCLFKLKRYEQAKYFLNRSIELNDRPSREPGDAAINKIKLANLHLQTQRPRLCKKLLEEVDVYLKDSPDPDIQHRLNQVKKRYYSTTGEYQNALFFANQVAAWQDSLDLAKKHHPQLIYFQQAFGSLKKEVELLQVQRSNARKNSYLIVSSALVVMLLTLGSFVLSRRKRERKYHDALKKMNQKTSQYNQLLLETLSNLEQSQQENTRFMRVVAHDLRSPLAGILNSIQLLQHEKFQENERQELLQLLEKSTENALNLAQDLMNTETTAKEAVYKQHDVAEVLQSCLKLMQHQAAKKNQSIHAHLKAVEIPLNQQKLWRAFNNLLNNAIKFSENGRSIDVLMEELPDAVLVIIRDQGIGIKASEQLDLFEVRTAPGKLGTKGEKSFGMGLAITKQIITAHQGEIWFESEEHKGTTFFVKLPKHRKP